MRTTATRTTFAAGILIGAAFGLTAGPLITPANATPAGQTQEDDPGWDCRVNGDRQCGPTNAQGVEAGCYSDTGALVAVWPCHVVVNPATGEGDVYEGYDPALPIEARPVAGLIRVALCMAGRVSGDGCCCACAGGAGRRHRGTVGGLPERVDWRQCQPVHLRWSD